METLAELREHVQRTIAEIGADFRDPDDDWSQMAMFDAEEGMVVMGLSGDLFANGLRKDVLARFLKHAMVECKARRYAVLFNTYMKEDVSEDEVQQVREGQRVSSMEGAREMLVLVYGDAEEENMTMTEIIRDGVAPPTLGEWKEPDGFVGRFSGLNEEMSAINV